MIKQYSWPQNHWNWPIKLTHKHGVRTGSMIWIGGQVDLNSQGEVLNPGNLSIQTRNVMLNIDRVLNDLDCDFNDLVTLLCFYVNNEAIDEREFLQQVANCLPGDCQTTVNAIPVPYLAYSGLMVEIEGYAMRRENGERTTRTCVPYSRGDILPTPFVQGLRSDKLIFVSGQYPLDHNNLVLCEGDIVGQTNVVASRMARVLEQFGASFDDVVKINRWYTGDSGVDAFEASALAFARNFSEPGPTATGIPIPRHANDEVLIKISAVAMLAENGDRLPRIHAWPDSLWDWHVHLPYKHGLKCEDMIFLGGQVSLDKKGRAVHPDDLSAQTHQAMRHIGVILNELGATYDDVCKITTVYQGSCGATDIHKNLPIRSSYFKEPGPATTGVPLPALAYESMVIEIDAFAMVDD